MSVEWNNLQKDTFCSASWDNTVKVVSPPIRFIHICILISPVDPIPSNIPHDPPGPYLPDLQLHMVSPHPLLAGHLRSRRSRKDIRSPHNQSFQPNASLQSEPNRVAVLRLEQIRRMLHCYCLKGQWSQDMGSAVDESRLCGGSPGTWDGCSEGPVVASSSGCVGFFGVRHDVQSVGIPPLRGRGLKLMSFQVEQAPAKRTLHTSRSYRIRHGSELGIVRSRHTGHRRMGRRSTSLPKLMHPLAMSHPIL